MSYIMSRTEHRALVERLTAGDAAGALELVTTKLAEQDRLRAAYEGSITCAESSCCHSNDEIQIDGEPCLSEVEDLGVWVAAWVWVQTDQPGPGEEEPDPLAPYVHSTDCEHFTDPMADCTCEVQP